MRCNIEIDRQPFSFEVEGAFQTGRDEVLFWQNNLLENVSWHDSGYTVIDLFDEEECMALERNVRKILDNILNQEGLPRPESLEKYHQVADTPGKHQRVIRRTRFLTAGDFDIGLDAVSRRVSDILGKKVGIRNSLLEEEIIILRISRPRSLDINPLHRDGYLDIWKNTINVWIPVAGCSAHSSLPLIPGSHLWNEKDVLRTQAGTASIHGLTYHVPGIVKGPGPLSAVRPNPKPGQALLFTPFLVHGAAINQQQDITRISLEFRLCR